MGLSAKRLWRGLWGWGPLAVNLADQERMPELDPSLIEEFHAVWDGLPWPCLLAHKSRTIIAANPVCLAGGRKPGMNCAKWGRPAMHRGCLADKALARGIPLCRESRGRGGIKRFCWIPLPGFPDYFIHFTIAARPLQGKAHLSGARDWMR